MQKNRFSFNFILPHHSDFDIERSTFLQLWGFPFKYAALEDSFLFHSMSFSFSNVLSFSTFSFSFSLDALSLSVSLLLCSRPFFFDTSSLHILSYCVSFHSFFAFLTLPEVESFLIHFLFNESKLFCTTFVFFGSATKWWWWCLHSYGKMLLFLPFSNNNYQDPWQICASIALWTFGWTEKVVKYE